MLRLVVLTGLLVTAAWFAHAASWLSLPLPFPLPPPTPHTAYAKSLENSGLANTPLGRAWHRASTQALSSPIRLALPWQHRTPFTADQPSAIAFHVGLKRGQQVQVMITVDSATPAEAFVDVFEVSSDERHLDSGALRGLRYEAERDRDILIRIQPELLRSGHLDISVRALPTFRFPVADARSRDLQSVFGDPRDAGRRQHEGVDIFARRGTPVLSATNGVVTRVGETARGGRVVWIWDIGRGLMLYYAHLHEQSAETGDRVVAGQVIGTVGNTGNARTTAPHLHFGIYERGRGAIDPYWFIAPPLAPHSALRE